MNLIRRLCRCPAGLSRRAAAVLTLAAAPALWRPDPPFPVGWRLPPGWDTGLPLRRGQDKHPPLPLGHVTGPVDKIPARILAHTAGTGGMHGWQIILIAAGAALVAAGLTILAHRLWAARRPAVSTARAMTAPTPVPVAPAVAGSQRLIGPISDPGTEPENGHDR